MNDLLEKKLEKLNINQREAVLHKGSPLFVVAGAGTGKTTTLTYRIVNLIINGDVNPSNILAVTFTNKAAREIRFRVNDLVYPYQMGSWLLTFHSFGLRILREHAIDLKLGYYNDFTVIDELESKSIISEIMEQLVIDSKLIKVGEVKDFISSLKMNTLEDFSNDKMFEIYSNYQKYLIKEQLMDFDDLLKYVYTLFKDNEEILKKYQNTFTHVLVDEFQDTDKIQYEILKLLNNPNTFVVGDPDQSIYSFRGARFENNDLFIKDFNAKIIVINENYRSTNNILKTANTLIKKNKTRSTEKDLVSNLGDGSPVTVVTLESDFEEVDYIIYEINKLLRKGLDYEDIAILYRNNVLSRNFEHKFIQADIPYKIYGGLSFYQRKEVKDILAYIKLVVDHNSNFFFKRIVNTPKRSIGKKTIEKLEEYSELNNISMFEAIDEIDLPIKTLNSLKEFKSIILTIKDKVETIDNIREVVSIVFQESNYTLELDKETKEVKDNKLENINELKTVFSMANNNPGNNIQKIKEVLDELALITDLDINYKEDNAVILATIHQVKGLEFRAVFVIALEDDIFPNHRAAFDYSKIDEERRLFYVAITRAKEFLYLTNAERRRLYGQFSFSRPSQFLKEIRINEPSKEKVREPQTLPKKTNNETFKISDIVIHNEFNRGIIVEIKGDVLTIAFQMPHGIKKILATHPSLKKETNNEEI